MLLKGSRFLLTKTLCKKNHPTRQLIKEELNEMLLKDAKLPPVSPPCKNHYLRNIWKFETYEQFHPISAPQNKGTEFNAKHAPVRKLHVQVGPKRRPLLCFFKTLNEEIFTVLVGGETLRVPLSLLWYRSSFSNICQSFKHTNFSLGMASD